MKRILSLLLILSAVTSASAAGKFSVTSTKQVEFAPGNVQYHTGTQQWRFADNQFDVIGVDDNIRLGDPELSAWIDLFAWSCESVYYGVNPSNKDADYTGDFVDWGGLFGNGWYTPSKDEFQYVLFNRANASNLRGEGTVNGMNGLILLPDDWTLPEGLTFVGGYIGNEEYTENVYNLEQWETMEKAGAIFLPHAGSRTGGYGNMWNGSAEATFVNPETGFYSWVDNIQVYGYYWSSTLHPSNSNLVYYLIAPGLDGNLQNYTAPAIWSRERRRGNSVRLIRDYIAYAINISDEIQHGSVVADKQTATQGETVTLTLSADNGYELDDLMVTTIDGESSRASVNTAEGAEPGTYTFEMPAAAVNVTATFKESAVTSIIDIDATMPSINQRYNLMGQPVSKDYKGIVIEDGHKIIVR
jgi:hypothetical protein